MKMFLFLLALIACVPRSTIATSTADNQAENSLDDSREITGEDSKNFEPVTKRRKTRAAQNYIVEEEKLLTIVNRVPVRVPVTRVS